MYPGGAHGQVGSMSDGLPFGSQQSPVSPGFPPPNSSRPGHVNNMSVSQVSSDVPGFSTALFDPSNPALFNFDLEGLNFGSHYGALEFGMLGHMSSGAAETPPREGSISQSTGTDSNYTAAPMYANGGGQYGQQLYENGMVDNYMNVDQNHNGMYAQGNLQHGLPHAYAVAAAGPTPNSLASPGTDNTASPQPINQGFDSSPKMGGSYTTSSQPIAHPPRPKPKTPSTANNSIRVGPQSILGKRRDPSSIYETVKEPYPYLTGFHNLIAFIGRRFSVNKTLRIAKSLASIRPSFIACTRTLNRQDLIFMEKCLQRTLFEYEDFMGHCPAPTIVCRRTGEVAAVNKEFIALTGWTKDILLGKEPNLNINTGESENGSGHSGGGAGTRGPGGGGHGVGGLGKPGLTTPRLKSIQPEKPSDGKQPVFMAEFMDDESVIQFYEDYAQLAFGDSRGSVIRNCRLLKYRTKEMNDNLGGGGGDAGTEHHPSQPPQPPRDPRSSILSSRVTRIDGEHGISKLEKDGRIDCSYCWTIKRDVFDIPMLIVMNVSRIIIALIGAHRGLVSLARHCSN